MSKSIHLPCPRSVLALLCTAQLAACGGGGTIGIGTAPAIAEAEPNDSTATANAIPVGTPVQGSLATAGDVDDYSFHLAQGSIVRIELCAARADQAGWDATGNVPRLSLWGPTVAGIAKLLEHDFSGNASDGWSFGALDLDIPMFEAPVTGNYYVSVTQDDTALAGGAYELRVLYPVVTGKQEEAELQGTDGGNDTPATAQTITPGTLHGFHVAGGVDDYTFTIDGPTTVRFEMTAYRNGVCRGDPHYYHPKMRLLDTDGTTELASDDGSFFFDPAIQHRFTAAGTYFVEVGEFSAANSEYFLGYATSTSGTTAETEPNDSAASADGFAYGGRVSGTIDAGEVDFFKFSGTKGDMVRLQRFDIANLQGAADAVTATLLATDGATALATGGGGSFQVATAILTETGTFYVKVEPGAAATSYALELSRFQSSSFESEANDTIPTADHFTTRIAGTIDPVGDTDVFSCPLSAGRMVRFACYASNAPTGSDGDSQYSGHGSSCSPLLEVLDFTGAVYATSTSAPVSVYTESVTDPLPTAAVSFVPAIAGIYYVRITDAAGGGGPRFTYVLEKK
jgi:hypothetical protein